jgi:copper chaperone CopZ
VTSAEADMKSHVMTVGFDDEATKLDAIIKALNDAGYMVGEPKKLD